MIKKLLYLCCCVSISTLSYANDLTGLWKTVDDKTGYSRADVEITKSADGSYSGKIITIRPLPDKPLEPLCLNCKGNLKNKPYVVFLKKNSFGYLGVINMNNGKFDFSRPLAKVFKM